ncbi:MAG: hypothetical protein Q8N05_14090 [Bacteroidota bacterium]|nr:hypothetical protein [Bacteroidota bacterium]
MRVRKRIISLRKQSRIAPPKKNLWFFSEDSVINQSPVTEKKSFRNDLASIFNDDYTRYSQGNLEHTRVKKECAFVVDWQMSDAF